MITRTPEHYSLYFYFLTNHFRNEIYQKETGKIDHSAVDAAQPIGTASRSCQPIGVEEHVGEPITARVRHAEPIAAPACERSQLVLTKPWLFVRPPSPHQLQKNLQDQLSEKEGS